MAAVILLFPIKLLGKALCHVLAAAIGAAGFILAFTGAITRRLLAFVGGMTLLSSIIILIFHKEMTLVLTGICAALLEILVPQLIIAAASGLYALKGKILEISSEIELIP